MGCKAIESIISFKRRATTNDTLPIAIINLVLHCLLGVSILGLSTYLYIQSQSYVSFEDAEHFYIAPFLVLMVLGAVMTIVGFLGCCGAVRESTCLLGTYFLFCITMCVACGAALFWVIQNSDQFKDRVTQDFQRIIKDQYGTSMTAIPADRLIERVQSDLECCGSKGPSDWATSKYNQKNRTGNSLVDFGTNAVAGSLGLYNVPPSCCKKGYPECEDIRKGVNPQAVFDRVAGIYDEGCIDKIIAFIEDKWKWVIIIGGVLIGVQFFALLFACCLCCAISRADDK